jgi:hypothetical protein
MIFACSIYEKVRSNLFVPLNLQSIDQKPGDQTDKRAQPRGLQFPNNGRYWSEFRLTRIPGNQAVTISLTLKAGQRCKGLQWFEAPFFNFIVILN